MDCMGKGFLTFAILESPIPQQNPHQIKNYNDEN